MTEKQCVEEQPLLIQVDPLTRVEGEGALRLVVVDGKVTELKLRIFEPPRFFQGFLLGRRFDEVHDLVSRICGICPVSYQMAALQAIEEALGVLPSRQTQELRRLLALSQWIASHALHIYFLALPDYLGYESALAMAGDHREAIERALRLKKLGNDLTRLIGGREVFPISLCVKGFGRVPSRADLLALKDDLEQGREDAWETARLVARLPLPDFVRPCEHVALTGAGRYPVNETGLHSSEGLRIPLREYRQHVKERQVPDSNMLHSYIEGRGSFLVGPLARVNLNFGLLSPAAQRAARESGVTFPSFNPFVSVVARAVELIHAIDECLELVGTLNPQEEAPIRVEPRAGEGFGATEAPRGILYHHYRLNAQGLVEKADIVAPTSHNLYNIEQDLWELAPQVLHLPLEEATLRCEMAIRNYDPCISCGTHFLKLEIVPAIRS
ncbi:MAG: Ni/Fe hydrogenase subunit alpha [Candidatus Tectomicrobia bacterium]|uniref:Ni/Fe hydrogenase subunit alpha n=1 Tax=Tectimicrobiota bacterium TaxID=2528274 RepID=A0A932CPG2_UNCTE|nr:Ni/Fe hydrogenase subunit alpha [Candidatus Tectomicrobia bacterium]